ncbi:MAG: PQQ-dependent sugar dehydrogenase, partial [Patescibacteria group bacterium]
MKKIFLYPLLGFFVLLIGAGVYFFQNPTSFLELFNFLNPPSLEPQGAIPSEQLKLVEEEIIVNGKKQVLNIPSGYKIEVIASGFERPRLLAIKPESGDLYVTDTGSGEVWNVSKKERTVAGIPAVHGIAFHNGYLYLASTTSIFRFKDRKLETLVNNLPKGGHSTATLVFGPDGKMYVSRGSSCNVCEGEVRRAAILRFNKDGKNEEVFATGLRNDIGMEFHPKTGELWTTENGRDYLGDNL